MKYCSDIYHPVSPLYTTSGLVPTYSYTRGAKLEERLVHCPSFELCVSIRDIKEQTDTHLTSIGVKKKNRIKDEWSSISFVLR